MPTRYLKPGIRDSERINALSADSEVLFYRLIVTVDDFGRFDARPAMVKAACFPIKDDQTSETCEQGLAELALAGLIAVYKVDGKPFLQMQKWDNAPRARESKYPELTDECVQLYTDACKPRAVAVIPRTLLPVTVTVTGTGTENREPETENRKPKLRTGKDSAGPATRPPTATGETWTAYCGAYQTRYGVEPVRNAKVNGQLAQLVGRLGDEAPAVAAAFVAHNNGLYVSAMHPTDLLLRDAEKLRTEWATRKTVTRTQANMTDRTQTNLNAFAPLLAEARAREEAHGK